MKPTLSALALTSAFALCAVASADLSIGGSKSAGMGGAGLALQQDRQGPSRRNPATYAFNRKFAFEAPQLRYSFQGLKFDELSDVLDTDSSGVLNSDNLGLIARTLGDESTRFGAALSFGLQFNTVGIDFGGEAFGRTEPNASLQNWVKAGSNLANVPLDARLDGYGLGTAEVGISTGQAVNVPKLGQVAVGVKLKLTRSYYSHYEADRNNIINGTSTIGPEMGGKSVLQEDGVGVDLGGHLNLARLPGGSVAMVINNAFLPDAKFNGEQPNSNVLRGLRPFPRTIDLGAAFDKGPWVMAVDIIDATNSGNRQELRFGGEIHAGRIVAVRAGYASRSGMSVGVGLGGFNLAFSGRMPLAASYAFKF